MGWGNPLVIGAIALGLLLPIAFVFVELCVPDPMFRLDLFKIRMFTAGNLVGFITGLTAYVSHRTSRRRLPTCRRPHTSPPSWATIPSACCCRPPR
jgi:hypothetical protein